MKRFALILFALILAVSAFAQTSNRVPVTIQMAELDNTEIFQTGTNTLDVERGEDIELRLELLATDDANDVEIEASIDGYEFSSTEKIEDELGPFDFKENTTYVKKLNFNVPMDIELDNYLLRIEIKDRNSDAVIANYELFINTARHSVSIDDVIFSPGNSVKAGQSLLAKVRLENKGQKDEKDVKVTMNIPELGLSTAHYIEEIENDDEEEQTEEFFFRIPSCAQAGTYDVEVEASFNKGRDKVTDTSSITVVQNEECGNKEAVVVVQQQPVQQVTPALVQESGSSLRTVLLVVLVVLVVLLVIVGIVIGVSRMKEE